MILTNKHNKKLSYTTDTASIYESTDNNMPISAKLNRCISQVDYAISQISEKKIRYKNNVFDKRKEYNANTIVRDTNNITYITRDKLYGRDDIEALYYKTGMFPISSYRQNLCVLKTTYTDSGHVLDPNNSLYNPEEISTMLLRDDYYGYIQNGDWFELETKDWVFKFLVNIDTYFNIYNERGSRHNIDLICSEIEPRIPIPNRSIFPPWTNVSSNDKTIVDTSVNNNRISYGSNVPIILGKLASDDWQNYLPSYVDATNPNGFGPLICEHIIPKIKSVPTRELVEPKPGDTTSPIDITIRDNGMMNMVDIGKVWFLYESEIYGYNRMSSIYDGMTCTQYPIFNKMKNRQVKFNGRIMPTITSSLFDKSNNYSSSTFSPIYYTSQNDSSNPTSIGSLYHPFCGMRFV